MMRTSHFGRIPKLFSKTRKKQERFFRVFYSFFLSLHESTNNSCRYIKLRTVLAQLHNRDDKTENREDE